MKKKINIPKTFFGFLLASLFFWTLINLSKEYTTQITIDAVYSNLPIKKTIISTPVKKIPLLVKGTGFKLISTNFNTNSVQLNLEKLTHKKQTDYYFSTNKLHSEIQNQLKSGINLIAIQKDTIPLKIGTLHSKKVPLKTNLDISFQLGYDLSKPIALSPASILISGEKSLIDEISFLNLKKIKLENLSEKTSIDSEIIIPDNIKASVRSAKINITIDQFTEGEIEVPVLIKNAPKEINIFPKKVKLIYKVGLQNFNKINSSLFKVECDYNLSKINEVSYLTPKITKLPDSISLVRMTPKKIDFLIHK